MLQQTLCYNPYDI